MMDTLNNPPKQPPVVLTLPEDVSNRLRGAARLCGVSPEVLANRIVTATLARVSDDLLATVENQPVVLAGFVGKAFRDIKRLLAYGKLLPDYHQPGRVDAEEIRELASTPPETIVSDATGDKESDQ